MKPSFIIIGGVKSMFFLARPKSPVILIQKVPNG